MAFFEASHHRALERKFIVLAGVFYSLMHAGIFFIPSAVFFDDWVIVDSSNETILEIFRQAGAMFNLVGFLHVGLVFLGVWSYKLLTFILMGAAGYFLNEILKKNSVLGYQLRWSIVLLFLLLPFNMARVALIDFPYALCYAMFFGAWLTIDRYRFLSAVLFFMSFNTNSLLVFYALPVLDQWYRSSGRYTAYTLVRFALARWELMVLPFLYFGIKFLFYRPEGFYAGYNQGYNLEVIPVVVEEQIRDLLGLRFNAKAVLVFFPFVYIALRALFNFNESDKRLLLSLVAMVSGVISIVLACFPYWILGYTPTFSDWTSRYQLLMPLGAALLVSGALLLLPKIFKTISLAVVVSACLSYGLSGYYHFYIDWQKQLFLLQEINKDPVISEANFIIIKDQTKKLDAVGRTYRFYEWNGILVRALGDDRRFALEPREVSRYVSGGYDKFFTVQYKSGRHVRSDEESVAVIELDLKSKDGESRYSRLIPKIDYKSRRLSSKEWAELAAEARAQPN